MGATTVLRCAARAPSRILGVVACDGTWRSMPGSEAMWEERFAIVRKGGMEAMAEPTARRWFQPAFYDSHPGVIAKIKDMIAGTKAEGYIACAKALQGYDFSADLPALAAPVLYLVGALDGDYPAIMKQMADATPNSRYRVIENAGHLPNVEQVTACNAAVDAFIRELGLDKKPL